ncbi:hypothetical protein LJC61_05275 [Ruminococcaceae bacterium OttesenSCG-928-A16]|nr:hypothetical protein [Ruminococcaceae bacterium OttesenSCG-928-A16]
MRFLSDLIDTLTPLYLSGGTYYRFSDLDQALTESTSAVCLQEASIVPFYIHEERVYEIYQDELTIRKSTDGGFETYILKKTGKNRMLDIDESILNKARQLYVQIPPVQDTTSLNAIREYTKYILHSTTIKQEIAKILGTFSPQELFFEYY